MTKPLKQIHLAAHSPGVNNTTVWSDPASGSDIDFNSFVHFGETAERGKFDFLFLAAVTEHLGLTGTINSTFNEPYELARQFASLDHLRTARAAWNVVTSWDAFTEFHRIVSSDRPRPSPSRSTTWCRPTPPTDSSSSPTSPPAGWHDTGSCR